MNNPWIFPAAALALGAVGGFLTGKNTASSTATNSSEDAVPRLRSASGRSSDSSESGKRTGSRARSTDEVYRAPGQTNRIQKLMDFYASLTPEQLEAEAGKLEDLPMAERIMASFLLFGKWSETDPTAAMAYTTKMGFTGNFVRPTILQGWASKDPAGAAKYYAENSREFAMMGMMGGGRGPMGGGGGASVIASEWARQDPTAAMDWASKLTGNEKGSAMTAVISEVASSDPKKAASMVSTMDADSQGKAYADIARKWGAKDFTGAEAWIATLPADQRNSAMAEAISGLSKENPKLAAQKVQTLPAGEERNDATATLVKNWSRENPRDAAEWLTKQEPSVQASAMGEVIPNWVSQDARGALAFVNSQPAGEVRDSAAAAYVMSDRKSPPAALLKVAESITDESTRNHSVMIGAAQLLREDPDAGKAYVQGSDAFSEDMKTRVAEGKPLWGGGGRGNRGGGNRGGGG